MPNSTEVKYFLVTLVIQPSENVYRKKVLIKHYNEEDAQVAAIQAELHDTGAEIDELSTEDFGIVIYSEKCAEITDFDEIQVLEKYL